MSTDPPTTTPEPLWTFIPPADYRPPQPPGTSAALDRWRYLRRLIQPTPAAEGDPVRGEHELRRLDPARLETLTGPIDWTPAATALDAALGDTDWGEAGKPSVCLVVGQPHGGHREILGHWAKQRDAVLLEAPEPARLLARDPDWPARWPAAGTLWVLPELAHYYLRHADGLGGIRRLLAGAVEGKLGCGLIGCDSWAFAYLRRVWPMPGVRVLTLQAFDGARLSRWLATLTADQAPVRFCHARSGEDLLPWTARHEDRDGHMVSAHLMRLAAHARGNPGVARHVWWARLRAEPEAREVEPDDHPPGEIIWVSDREMSEPEMAVDEDTMLVLHALLLHEGLPDALLPIVLPMPEHRIEAILLSLRQHAWVDRQADRWRVNASAYIPIRALLWERGFLLDDY